MRIISRMLGWDDSHIARSEPVITAGSQATSGTSNPHPWLTDIGWGTRSNVKTLPRVTATIAQKHATVTTCCSIIAGDLAKVPLKLYRRLPDGQEERVRDHPAVYLLNVEASPGIPAWVTRFGMAYDFLLGGKSLAYSPRDGAGELVLIDHIRHGGWHMMKSGRDRFYDFEDGAGVRRRVPIRSVIHMRYMAQDGWTGRSPIEVAAETIGIALAGQEAAAKNAVGGSMSAFIGMPDDFEDQEAYDRSVAAMKEALRDPASGRFAIGPPGVDIKRLDMSAVDRELLAGRKFDVKQIAGLYRVPLFKLADPEGGVKANSEQAGIDYEKDCLTHWGTPVEQQLMLGALTEQERRAGYFFRHDFAALLRPSIRDQYETMKIAVGGPFASPNTAQTKLGLPVTEGDDKLYPPSNMTRDDNTKGGDDA